MKPVTLQKLDHAEVKQAIAEKYRVPVKSVKYSGYSFYIEIETEAKDGSQKE